MLTALLLVAMVLPAMMLGHMAHEEFQSQKAYRRAQPRPILTNKCLKYIGFINRRIGFCGCLACHLYLDSPIRT